ncbi:MAG: hypothetical protein GF341_09175 [candidate division Zixibacteria bacterium]|nr:hypothetical protein [candidate division Zixibacteria bacterium]
MWRRMVPALALATVFTVVVGCSDDDNPVSGNGNGNGSEDISFSADVQPILTANCTNSACHDATDPQEGLNLEAGSAYGNLVDVNSSQNSSLKRVDPGNPDDSYLVRKLEGTAPGFRMPRNQPPLSDAQIQLIRDWIEQGALDN